MWFKKKVVAPLEHDRYWEIYPQFRWHRIASGWNGAETEYKYITEPVLQYKATKNTEWRQIDTNVEVMTLAKASNA